MGAKNPFRYRGYYYDTETGLFYVVSRYYNPEIGRFISKDDPSYHVGSSSIDANLYAYCSNDPVNTTDVDGHFGTPVEIAIGIGINVGWWAFDKYLIHHDRTWHTSDTVELVAAIITGMLGGWGGSYLRARATKFAWGVYSGVKAVLASYAAHYGRVSIWWIADQVGSVLITSGIGAFL